MTLERTFSIIKPDATKRNITGNIIARLERASLRIIAQKRILMTRKQAESFYAVHSERPFFADLVSFMTSGAVVVMVLEGDDAVSLNRRIMGATDPSKAEKGTIRADFAVDIEKNSVHGSDSLQNAQKEIYHFFSEAEIIG